MYDSHELSSFIFFGKKILHTQKLSMSSASNLLADIAVEEKKLYET